MTNIQNLPQQLKESALFCVWKYAKRDNAEKPTKVPYNPRTGFKAKSNNPDTFAPLPVAEAVLENYDGLGIGVFGDICAIDIDHCVGDDGTVTELCSDIISAMNSYTEYSPSGKGFRILFRAPGLIYDKAQYYINNQKIGLEIYVAGATKKFLTVTGNCVLNGFELEDRADELQAVLEKYMLRHGQDLTTSSTSPHPPVSAGERDYLPDGLKRDDKLRELWDGRRDSSDESANDLALMNKLAYWCNRDIPAMIAAFISSPFASQKDEPHLKKMQRKDYLQRTAERAAKDCPRTAAEDDAKYHQERIRIAFGEPIQVSEPSIDADTAARILEEAVAAEPASANDLLTDDVMDVLFSMEDELAREREIAKLRDVAQKGRFTKTFDTLIKARKAQYESELQALVEAQKREAAKAAKPKTETITLKGIPLEGLIQPDDWIVDYRGVRRLPSLDNMGETEIACTHPIIITERLENVDTGAAHLMLSFYRDSRWKNVPVKCSTAASRQAIVSLADTGILVNSENAKSLVRYLHDLEAVNSSTIPLHKSLGRLGWINGSDFSPYSTGYVFDGDDEQRKLYDSVRVAGRLEEWLAMVGQARERSPIVRALLAASFCSPLLEKLGKQSFCVHLWGFSGHGKTVAIYTVMSVWGRPEHLTQSFNATLVGMQKCAETLYSVPLALDEREAAGKVDLSTVIYTLTEKQGRLKGTRSGGLQSRGDWNLSIITNGENPLLQDDSKTGMYNRVIEMYCEHELFEDAPGMADFVKENYGAAGKAWIEALVFQEKKDKFLSVRKMYDYLFKNINADKQYTDKPMGSLSMLLLADWLVSVWLFEEDNDTACRQALELGASLKEMLPTKRELDQTERAWEWVQNWVLQNKDHFAFSNLESWGKVISNDEIFVMSKVLGEALIGTSFTLKSMVKGFREKGYLHQTRPKSMSDEYRINGGKAYGYRLYIKTTWASSMESPPSYQAYREN